MFKKIVGVLVLIIAALCGFIAMRPADFKIERSKTVAAPPDVVFALVNDFRRWSEWSPWEKLDPAMKRVYSGSPAGMGAMYHWTGNDQVGEGLMTISESQPNERIQIRLDFVKPWAATNTTVFTFRPNGAGTSVNWTMTGKNNFMAKAFGLFMDLDKMVGPDFERGLTQLDAAAAAEAQKKAAPAAAPPAA